MNSLAQRVYRAWLAQNGQTPRSAGNGLGRSVRSSRSMPVPPPPRSSRTSGTAPAGGGVSGSMTRQAGEPVRGLASRPEKRTSFISE